MVLDSSAACEIDVVGVLRETLMQMHFTKTAHIEGCSNVINSFASNELPPAVANLCRNQHNTVCVLNKEFSKLHVLGSSNAPFGMGLSGNFASSGGVECLMPVGVAVCA